MAILFLMGVCIVLGLPTLVYPFGRDQGIYAYSAWAWLEGAMPYRDVFVFKPPMTVFVHALAQVMFGHSMTSIRIFDLVWTMSTGAVLFRIGLLLFGRREVAFLAGALFPLLFYQHRYWDTAQTDAWLNLPIAGAVLAVLESEARRLRGWARALLLALAGACLAVAVLFKYTAALAGLLPLALLAGGWRRERSRIGPDLVALTVGGLAPLIGAGLWLQLGHAWSAFQECQVDLVGGYVRQRRRSGALFGLGRFVRQLFREPPLRSMVAAVVLASIGGWATFRDLRFSTTEPAALEPRGSDDAGRAMRGYGFAGLWLLVGMVSCIAQGKFFRYHYLAMLAPLALLAAPALVRLWAPVRRIAGTRARAGLLALAAVLVYLGSTPFRPAYGQLLRAAELGSLSAYWAEPGPYKNKGFRSFEDVAAATYLHRTTQPDDAVFIWGYDPGVNFLAERKTVSRFLYNYPLVVSWGSALYDDELLEALRQDPPTVFIVASEDSTEFVTGEKRDSRELFQAFAALKQFVDDGYLKETVIGTYDIYRRKQ